MTVEQNKLPKSVSVEKSLTNGEYKIRMPLWVYRTIGLVLLVAMLVACGDISVEPSASDVQPVVTTTNVESVPTEAAEDGAGDLPDPDEEMVEVTITVPTQEAPATATPEVDPTRDAVERFAGYSALSDEDKAAIVDWGRNANLGLLGSPESFQAINGYQLRVIGNFGEGSTYQYGDIIQRMEGGDGYFPVTAKALDSEGNEVEVTTDFTLETDGETPRFILVHGVTPLYWNAPTGERFRFDYVTEEFYPENVYDELIEVREAQAAGFVTVVSTEYDEVTGLTYGLDANGTRVAVEDETGWQEVEPAREWLFGPEEKVPSLLEGAELPSKVIVHDEVAQKWYETGIGALTADDSTINPNHVRILSGDEFYQRQQEYINGALTTAFIRDIQDRLGSNYVIGQVTAVIPLKPFEYTNRHGLHVEGITAYTYTLDDNGNLVMIVTDVVIQSSASDAEYNHFAGSPDSDLQRRKTLPTEWGTMEEFAQALLADPNNPDMLLVFGDHSGEYYSGEGDARRIFDSAARGNSGFTLDSTLTATDLGPYRWYSGPLSFGGIMLTEPLE